MYIYVDQTIRELIHCIRIRYSVRNKKNGNIAQKYNRPTIDVCISGFRRYDIF